MTNINNTSFKNNIIQKLGWQLFGCIIPTLMGIVASSSTVKEFILDRSPDWLTTCLSTGWMQVLLILTGAIVIPLTIYYIIEYNEYRKRKTGYEILLNLISNIGKVVEKKRHRFRDIRNCNLKSDVAIFHRIAKPMEQISHLCQALCLMMQFLTNNKKVKSTLFHCKNGVIIKAMAVCGEDELRAKITDLNNNSLAKQVLVSGTSIISSNIDNEVNFYKPMGCNTKSVYIHPIYEGDEVLFIVCFTSQQNNTFKKKDIKKYEEIIEEFSNRIMLEWHLLVLLEQKNNEKK